MYSKSKLVIIAAIIALASLAIALPIQQEVAAILKKPPGSQNSNSDPDCALETCSNILIKPDPNGN
jgi:hypothetical protein